MTALVAEPRLAAPIRAVAPRFTTLRLIAEALRDGLEAAHTYETLKAKGLPPAEAAARALQKL